MKILLFSDSRGQHKPAGQNHPVFGELLCADTRVDVDLYMCPMKWTTTLDFLEMFEQSVDTYDAVILYTGIVEWSPRPASSAINDLYDNQYCVNIENTKANTRDYSRKVVNNKKRMFDSLFGEQVINDYYQSPFDVTYNGEKTINMYGLEMAKARLLPRLKNMKNLVYINANRFLPGWEGDFKKGRPANIDITHAYSDLFTNELRDKKIVDLREWEGEDIKRFTCDNLHLSKEGSDFIYAKLTKILDLNKKTPQSVSFKTTSAFEELGKVFSEACILYRDHKYPEALNKYVWLATAEDRVHLYKQAAVNCYMRAKEYKQICLASDVAYVHGLVVDSEVAS